MLQGPVPSWKLFGTPGSGNGAGGTSFGLPRFRKAVFTTRFPFAVVQLTDNQVPLEVELTAWSPFEPGDADSSEPAGGRLGIPFHEPHRRAGRGGLLVQRQELRGDRREPAGREGRAGRLPALGRRRKGRPLGRTGAVGHGERPGVRVNCAWFRGGWFDPLTMAWKDVAEGACFDRPAVSSGGPSPGATLFVPLAIGPHQAATVVLRLAWYAGQTNLSQGKTPPQPGAAGEHLMHRPWYAGRFAGIDEVTAHWRQQYDALRARPGVSATASTTARCRRK